jgi:hypothetical protein
MIDTTTTCGRVERVLTPAESQWWLRRADSMRLGNPVARWVGHLLEEAADTTVTCPRCRCRGRVVPILDHAFWSHGLSFTEAAAWLELIDADLFSLAVHYLAWKGQARTAWSSPA